MTNAHNNMISYAHIYIYDILIFNNFTSRGK